MIRRIRQLAAALHEDITDDLRAIGSQIDGEAEPDDDPGLDLLVKNAVRSNWLEHDPRRVWQQLSERVRGPFGQMAVEQPALAGLAMPLTHESEAVNERTPERMRHGIFRLSDGVLPQR